MAPSRTKYPDIFAALAAPFTEEEIRKKPTAGRQLRYITARTAMNRLDDVLGPENWWDCFIPGENSVLCSLTIRLPDGNTITKSDAGGYAGMSDEGDDDKSGYSDAFKRASVKFGIARYLYGDGVPRYQEAAAPPAAAPPAAAWPPPGKGEAYDDDFAPQPPEPAPARDTPGRQFRYVRQMIDSKVATAIGRTRQFLTSQGWQDRDAALACNRLNEFRVINALATRLTSPEVGMIEPGAILGPNGKRDSRKVMEQLQRVYIAKPGSLAKTTTVVLKGHVDEILAAAEEGEILSGERR